MSLVEFSSWIFNFLLMLVEFSLKLTFIWISRIAPCQFGYFLRFKGVSDETFLLAIFFFSAWTVQRPSSHRALAVAADKWCEAAFCTFLSRFISPFSILKALKSLLKTAWGQFCSIVRNKFLYWFVYSFTNHI